MEDLYPTNRENGKLVDNELLAWLQNFRFSETFKGENISKILLKREGSISSLIISSSKTLKRNNKIDL